MSEENTNQDQEQQVSPVEREALEQGWVPKEQFHGDEHKWVDAGEFLRRGELFKKIDLQNREIKDVRRALQMLSKHHEDVRQVEYQRALETLKAQKKDALENGDADAVIAADERIDMVRDAIRKQAAEPPPIKTSGEEHPTFVEWKSKNQWYSENRPMQAFADALGAELAATGMSPDDVLKRVEQEVRKEFPNRFQNPRQQRPGALEGTTPRGSSSSGSFQLTDEQTRIMNTLVRQKVLTKEQYIAELKKVNGV